MPVVAGQQPVAIVVQATGVVAGSVERKAVVTPSRASLPRCGSAREARKRSIHDGEKPSMPIRTT